MTPSRQSIDLSTEGNTESDTWEHEWLKSSLVGIAGGQTSLADKAVWLRIDKGSQEASFLAAFSAVDDVPKVVIISNGKVLEDIVSGTTREAFASRIASACGQDGTTEHTSPMAGPSAFSQAVNTQADASSSTTHDQPTARTSQVDTLLAERKAKLEKAQKEKEQAEREARKAVGKARRDEAEKESAATTSSSRQSYLDQQRSRQKEAKSERERVLRMIEDDKAARREREEQRRLLAQGDAASTVAEAGSSAPSVVSPTSSQSRATVCALQIRLFDGTSIRSRFSPDVTITNAVRTFVSENSTTDVPYNFRHMQTPRPSRTIDVAEENKTLLSLGLCPSATLVLVPVKDYADAYATGGATGLLTRGVGMGYSLVSGAFGLVGGVVGRVAGYGGDAAADGPYVAGIGDEQEPSNAQGSKMAQDTPSSTGPGVKIRTLADQRRENENNEFYNGNQVR